MPWPFRRHRPHDGGQAAPSTAPPVTVDDLGGHRRLMVHAGSWQRLEPLTPSATGAAAPVVSSGASFIGGLAGTRPLIGASSLREVSSVAPRGVTHGLARPLSDPHPIVAADEADASDRVGADQIAAAEAPRRPVVASGHPTHADLTAYVGELTPAEPAPDMTEPGFLDDEVAEEFPPPIF